MTITTPPPWPSQQAEPVFPALAYEMVIKTTVTTYLAAHEAENAIKTYELWARVETGEQFD